MKTTGAFLTLLGLAGCTRQHLPPPSSGEPPDVPQAAVGQRVSRSVCELEQQCGRIGPGHELTSVEACTAATKAKVADAVDVEDCQDGAWASRIAACEDAIRVAGCDAEVDPGQIPACNEDLMCFQPKGGGAARPKGTEKRGPTQERGPVD